MSAKYYRKIPIELRPARMPHFQKLVSASWDIIEVVGVYYLKYSVGNREMFQPSFV